MCVCVCVCVVLLMEPEHTKHRLLQVFSGEGQRMGLEFMGRRDPHPGCCSRSLERANSNNCTHPHIHVKQLEADRVARSGWEDLGHLWYSVLFSGIYKFTVHMERPHWQPWARPPSF